MKETLPAASWAQGAFSQNGSAGETGSVHPELDLAADFQRFDDVRLAAAAGALACSGIIAAFSVANVPVRVLVDAETAHKSAVSLLQALVGHAITSLEQCVQ